MSVTEEQVQQFEDLGYLKYQQVLESDEIAALCAGLDEVAAAEIQEADNSSPEFAHGHRRQGQDYAPGQRHITQFVNMWKRHPAYREVLAKPAIVEPARALLRSNGLRVWHDHIISKPPGDNGHFRFHQDFYFWPLWPPNLLSVWIALDDATVQNGCMHVVPRSHLDPRFRPKARLAETAKKEADPAFITEREKMEQEPASLGLPIELKAGECMFHHCLNFHATPQNGTDRERRALVLIYMADNVTYFPEQSPKHVLVPTIEVAPGAVMDGDGFPKVA